MSKSRFEHHHRDTLRAGANRRKGSHRCNRAARESPRRPEHLLALETKARAKSGLPPKNEGGNPPSAKTHFAAAPMSGPESFVVRRASARRCPGLDPANDGSSGSPLLHQSTCQEMEVTPRRL